MRILAAMVLSSLVLTPWAIACGKHNQATRQEVTLFAKRQVGDRYVWGSAGPRYFDCSGLVDWAYKMAGYDFTGRLTTFLARHTGWSVKGHRLRPADMIIMDDGGHMGMYLGHGRVIHASSYFGRVVVTPLTEIRPRILDVRRVLKRSSEAR